MKLTDSQIVENWEKYKKLSAYFPTRKKEIDEMHTKMEERMVLMPASSINHYHNAFEGGYVDHVLRVVDNINILYDMYKKIGMLLDNFTLEEARFSAYFHDLGKYGLMGEGNHIYELNQSEWHIKNQGKMYNVNPNLQSAKVQDTSLFLLQFNDIKCSFNEQLAIRTHDGLYDEANKSYYITHTLESKFRTNLPLLLHQADILAARWEFERWAKVNNTFQFNLPTNTTKDVTTLNKKPNWESTFDALFDNLK